VYRNCTSIQPSNCFKSIHQSWSSPSGFDSENRLPWDVRVLFKTLIIFFIKVHINKSMSVLLTLQILPLDFPLSKSCCRRVACEGRVHGSRDLLSIGWPTEWLMFVARRIYPVRFDPAVRLYRPKFEFWQSVNKKILEDVIRANLSGVSTQRIGCQCVSFGETSRDSTTIKEVIFCTFDLTFFPSVSTRSPIFPVMKEDY
jgi:hypothetical protein